MDLRTSNEWKRQLYPNSHIIDFDGFDRSNLQYSFYEELITQEQFEQRFVECTVFCNKDYVKQF